MNNIIILLPTISRQVTVLLRRRFFLLTLMGCLSLNLVACKGTTPPIAPTRLMTAIPPTSAQLVSPTPVSIATEVPSIATQTVYETFTLTGEQALQVAVFMNFIRAYNNGWPEEALALLAQDAQGTDCNYESVGAAFFRNKVEAVEWLRARIADRARLEVSSIYNHNPDPKTGARAIGVEYSRRTSLTLEQLGFTDGIVPKGGSKVVFTSEPPTLIKAFVTDCR